MAKPTQAAKVITATTWLDGRLSTRPPRYLQWHPKAISLEKPRQAQPSREET